MAMVSSTRNVADTFIFKDDIFPRQFSGNLRANFPPHLQGEDQSIPHFLFQPNFKWRTIFLVVDFLSLDAVSDLQTLG